MFQSFTILYGETFWSAEIFSKAKGSQHLSVWQALLPKAKERSRRSTEHARLQSLASQVFFPIWKGVWGTLPCFHFYFGVLGSFCSKTWKEKGTSAHLWNTLALAFGGSTNLPRKSSYKDALEGNTLTILGFTCSREDIHPPAESDILTGMSLTLGRRKCHSAPPSPSLHLLFW